MKILSITSLALLSSLVFTPDAWSKPKCITAKQAAMPDVADLVVPSSDYTVGICYLPEIEKDGRFEDHADFIVLKKAGSDVIRHQTKMSLTVGRIADLVFQKATSRFIAVSYDAGEFCNGIVFYDVQKNAVARAQACTTPSDICGVKQLTGCKAVIECNDKGAEGELSVRKTPLVSNVDLCKVP